MKKTIYVLLSTPFIWGGCGSSNLSKKPRAEVVVLQAPRLTIDESIQPKSSNSSPNQPFWDAVDAGDQATIARFLTPRVDSEGNMHLPLAHESCNCQDGSAEEQENTPPFDWSSVNPDEDA